MLCTCRCWHLTPSSPASTPARCPRSLQAQRRGGGKGREESYKRYVHRVLQQVHPGLNISSRAMEVGRASSCHAAGKHASWLTACFLVLPTLACLALSLPRLVFPCLPADGPPALALVQPLP